MRKGKFLLLLLLLLGCSNNTYLTNELVIFKNNYTKNNTELITFNKELNNVKNHQINTNSIGLLSTPIYYKNDKIYDISYSLKNLKLIELNLKKFKSKTISRKVDYPNTMVQNNNLLFYSSNFQNNNTLTSYNLKTKEYSDKSYSDYFFNHLIISDNILYAFTTNQTTEQEELLTINSSNLNIIKKVKLNTKVTNYHKPIMNDKKIFFFSYTDKSNMLNIINTKTFKKTAYPTKLDYPAKMIIHRNILHVLNSDTLTLTNNKPLLLTIELSNMNFNYITLKSVGYDMIFYKGKNYLLGRNSISIYHQNKLLKYKEIKLNEDEYLTSIFINKKM